MKLSKDEIIHAVHEEECPMLANLNLKTITKDKLIEHLKDACCPVLEKLAGIE
jgi:hypothetical protein